MIKSTLAVLLLIFSDVLFSDQLTIPGSSCKAKIMNEAVIWNEGGIVISDPPSKRSSVSVTMDSPSGNELQKLADYLVESSQTVFDFFRSIDLDDSGEIDTMEFQLALKNASIGNLPPWDVDTLVSQMDLNSDGKLDLPELDIAITSLVGNRGEEE